MKKIIYIVLVTSLMACAGSEKMKKRVEFDIQGHRGARGLYPENTLPAFLHALQLGVTTLELDLAVTADQKLVVSHEPYMSSAICLTPEGNEISEIDAVFLNIYKMKAEEVRLYDCGSKGNVRFPEQVKVAAAKPLLTDVFEAIESAIDSTSLVPVFYNIELKSMAEYDDIYHPSPEAFADLVFQTVDQYISWDRVTIQSFDFRVLQVFQQKYPDVQLALLIENDLTWQQNIDSLGFTPPIYSCYFKLLNEQTISELHAASMQVVPWTVNETNDMQQLIGWGVDGIITDYPDRLIGLVKK